MSGTQKELVLYRLGRAKESLAMAVIAASKQYWNSAASELYYACYYSVIALFAKHNIKTSTHTGVRTKLGEQFIREGKLNAEWGKLLTKLFYLRQDGDYGDFVQLKDEDISPLLKEVEAFILLIENLVKEN